MRRLLISLLFVVFMHGAGKAQDSTLAWVIDAGRAQGFVCKVGIGNDDKIYMVVKQFVDTLLVGVSINEQLRIIDSTMISRGIDYAVPDLIADRRKIKIDSLIIPGVDKAFLTKWKIKFSGSGELKLKIREGNSDEEYYIYKKRLAFLDTRQPPQVLTIIWCCDKKCKLTKSECEEQYPCESCLGKNL